MQQWLNTLLIVDARHSLLTGAEGVDGESAIPAAEGGNAAGSSSVLLA